MQRDSDQRETHTPDIQPASTTVTATALGSWPGTDPAEATRIIRGELGDPHLPFLVELPARGPGADALGRTAALLVDLAVDVQPHGWRLVPRPGKDHRRAVSLLGQDINALADVAGVEERPGKALKVSLRGPLSLAAGLYLHSGERALSDAGARRELLQSLAAGAADFVARVREAVPGADIIVQLDEPDIADVLGGTIPTASGYRTLRSVPASEVSSAWQQMIEALSGAGAAQTVLRLPEAARSGALRAGAQSPFALALGAGADGAALPAEGLTGRDWEGIAEAVEGGRSIWLGVLPVPGGDNGNTANTEPRQVKALVQDVLRPWSKIGLPATALPALRLTPAGELAEASPSSARRVLSRLTQTAEALTQVAAEG
ncbi:hypothetical protein KKR91_12535 [Arthrobacter jiangjiafuii]|uniref:Cobalamin-independent synthase, Catalytic domain n=1 Tax=Arthrobacter jiangjiafuii TaxID=2817475 RepID=A0A975M4J2_9MICC|nr:hypothetical protein [Arthrobacter jiangjiafuii]MBP3044587.1 hypothetical protein [Arthrobacter jiangjiafuii]QWC09311.1 hypothetical protein KKR91_12535 [Arthrobacter jiangjiafuii]